MAFYKSQLLLIYLLIEFGSKVSVKKIIIKNAKIDKINVIFLPYYHTKLKYKMEDCWLD